MADNLSNYLENALLDHSLGTASFTMPSNVYLALYTTAPSDSGGGTEVSGSGYARQAITFDAATGGTAENSNEPEFNAVGGNFGTIVAVGLFDATTAGNLLWHGPLTTSRTINDGETLIVREGQLTATLS